MKTSFRSVHATVAVGLCFAIVTAGLAVLNAAVVLVR